MYTPLIVSKLVFKRLFCEVDNALYFSANFPGLAVPNNQLDEFCDMPQTLDIKRVHYKLS